MKITDKGIEVIGKSIIGLLKDVVITVDEKDVTIPIYRAALDKDIIKIFIMVDESNMGTITGVNIRDINNNYIINDSEKVLKEAAKGLLYVYKLKIKEVIDSEGVY